MKPKAVVALVLWAVAMVMVYSNMRFVAATTTVVLLAVAVFLSMDIALEAEVTFDEDEEGDKETDG